MALQRVILRKILSAFVIKLYVHSMRAAKNLGYEKILCPGMAGYAMDIVFVFRIAGLWAGENLKNVFFCKKNARRHKETLPGRTSIFAGAGLSPAEI